MDEAGLSLAQAELDKMWSVQQVAEHHKVPEHTVQRAARTGNIEGAIQILGRHLFNPAKAAEWVPGEVTLRIEGRETHSGGPFKKGNTLAVGSMGGRPSRKTEVKYLKALSRAVGPEEWMAIITKAVAQAQDGDWRARKWLSDYLMGTPAKRILAKVDITETKTLELGERAAAVAALLKAVEEREGEIVDVTPKAIG